MDKAKRSDPQSAYRRPLAWLLLLAGIPIFIALSLGWAELYFRVKSSVASHLSGFWMDLLEGFIGDVGIPALATAAVLYFGAGFFAERAEYLCRTRRGWRYIVLTVLGFALAFLALVGRLPLPYKPNPSVSYNLCLGLGVYGLSMGKTFWDVRKNRKNPPAPESVCVFCYWKQAADGKMKLEPFATVTGAPRLVRDDGSMEIPECPGKRLDAELFDRVWRHVAREERVMEQKDWKAVWVFDSFFNGYEVAGAYLMVLNRGEESWRIGDARRISPDQKSYPAFSVGPDPQALGGQLKNSRNYSYLDQIGWDKSPRDCPRAVWERAEKKAGRTPAAPETPIPLLASAADEKKAVPASAPKPIAAVTKPVSKSAAPAAKTAAAATTKTAAATTKTTAPATKAASKPAAPGATARKTLTEPERKALVQFIYGRDFSEIWAAIDKRKLPIQNVYDIGDGKLSDEDLSALAEELKRTAKQDTKQTPATKQTPTPKPTPTQAAKPTPAAKQPASGPKKLIHIALDSSLTEAERQTVARAVEHTQMLLPGCSLEIMGQGKSAAAEGIRKHMDVYLEGAQQENGRWEASLILRKMEGLAQYKKAAAVTLLFTGRDLCLSAQGASWCFGAGNRERHTAVCSLYRYRELTEPERLRCVRRTLRHEIGHALGVAMDPKRPNTERQFGIHCTAPGCTMRQAGTLEKLLRFSLEEERQGQWFCPACRAELDRALAQTE